MQQSDVQEQVCVKQSGFQLSVESCAPSEPQEIDPMIVWRPAPVCLLLVIVEGKLVTIRRGNPEEMLYVSPV